jgi:uncharacterized OsmC-like protein
MTDLNHYLAHKRRALTDLRAAVTPDGAAIPRSVTVRAEGRSGVRRIRVRDFQIISDSPADFAGYDLGPSSPELLLSALGSCLTHSYLIQAADLGIPLDSLEVRVFARQDIRAGLIGKEHPVFPDGVTYDVRIETPPSPSETERLREAVERACPVLNLLQKATAISGTLERNPSGERIDQVPQPGRAA